MNDITIKKFRDCLIRFRFGINELAANKRYHVISDKCPFCPDKVEDEDHFLFICPAYTKLRLKFLHQLLGDTTNPSLRDMMTCSDAEYNRKLAMFVFYAFKERDQLLEGL